MKSTKSVDRAWTDGFYSGVLAALACVYDGGHEVTAEEIVSAVGSAALLRVAKREDDICLPELRKTVRFLRQRSSMRARTKPDKPEGS